MGTPPIEATSWWQAMLLCHRSRWEQNTVEGGHYMDLQKLQGCRCLGGPVAGVLVAGGSVMAFSTVIAVSWDRFPSCGNCSRALTSMRTWLLR